MGYNMSSVYDEKVKKFFDNALQYVDDMYISNDKIYVVTDLPYLRPMMIMWENWEKVRVNPNANVERVNTIKPRLFGKYKFGIGRIYRAYMNAYNAIIAYYKSGCENKKLEASMNTALNNWYTRTRSKSNNVSLLVVQDRQY